MKNLLLLPLLLIILSATSCKKEVINERNCTVLPRDFIGKWKWHQIKNVDGNWEFLSMGVLQDITITKDSIFYDNTNWLNCSWMNTNCSYVKGFSESQIIKVSISSDTMFLKGVSDLTEWKLLRN